jgi:hypothetical protein
MISKGIVVAWSTFLGLLSFYEADQGNFGVVTVIVNLLAWAIVVVPVSSVGRLFEKPETDQKKIERNNQVLAGIAVVVGVLVVASQGGFPHSLWAMLGG